jgi:hypothetical protein
MGSKSVNFVDSEIEGNVFILADEINFKNTTVNGTLFIGSVTATLDVTADSAYIMGDTINFESTSIFNKDVKAVAEYVSFEGVVYRDLAIYANTIETGKNARVYRNASIKVADGEFSEDIVLGDLDLSIVDMSEENRAQTVKEKLFDSLASFIAILVIAIIILVFFNKFVQVNKDLKVRDFIITLFTGLLEIFLGIFIAFMIMVTGYGIGYASALISLVITFAGLGKAIFVVAYAIRLAGRPEKISKLKVFFMVIFVALVIEAINCLSLLGSVASIIVAIFNIIIGISGFGTLLKVIFTKKCSKPKQKSPETPESKAEKESIKSEIREELKEEFEETKNQPHPQQEEPPKQNSTTQKQKSPKNKKEENSKNSKT